MNNIQSISKNKSKLFIFSKIFIPRKINLARILESLSRRIQNPVKHLKKEIFKKIVNGCLSSF